MTEQRERLKFTDSRGPYGLSAWWWLLFSFLALCLIGGIGTAISAAI